MKCKDIKSMVFGHMINVKVLSSYLNLPQGVLPNEDYLHIATLVAIISAEVDKNLLDRVTLRNLIKVQSVLEVLL